MKDLENIDCPLCGRPEKTLLFKSRDFLFSKEEFSVVRCTACGARYTDPRVKAGAISAYYPAGYCLYLAKAPARGRSSAPREFLGRLFGNTDLRVLDTLRKRGAGKVLEIGPGAGKLLFLLKDNGFDVTGVDTDEACVRAIGEAGVKCIQGDLGNVKDRLPANEFDAVILHHALEHLYSPAAALRDVSGLLKAGGTVLISLPDAGSWEAGLFGKYWKGLDLPRHIVHYDRATARKVLAEAGFDSIEITPAVFPSSFVESVGFFLFGGRLPGFLYFLLYYPLKLISPLTVPLAGSGAMDISANKSRERAPQAGRANK